MPTLVSTFRIGFRATAFAAALCLLSPVHLLAQTAPAASTAKAGGDPPPDAAVQLSVFTVSEENETWLRVAADHLRLALRNGGIWYSPMDSRLKIE